MAFSYQIVLNDPNDLGGSLDAPLEADLSAALADWSRYINGTGTLIVALNITTTPAGRADAGSTAYGYVSTTGGMNVYLPSSIEELTTGTHLASSDITINVDPNYLLNDLWVNPTPGDNAAVPPNLVDATSVMLHEVGHGLGFLGFTDPSGVLGQNESAFDQYIQKNPDGTAYFVGPNAEQVYGGPVPLTTLPNGEGYAHLANSLSDPLGLDLMNGVAFYTGRAYDISNVDLAILKDVGVPVTRYIGPTVLTAQVGDTLLQGLGGDTLVGLGSGTNTLTFDLTGNANVAFTETGPAMVIDQGQQSTVVGGIGAETIYGGTGSGNYFLGLGSTVAVGGTGAGTWIGNVGSITFYDSQTGNLLFAGTGALTFVNEGGSSTVVGGAGQSVLYGSAGGSMLFIPAAPGSLLIAGSGNETLTAAFSTHGVDMFAGAGNDVLTGSAGNDAFMAGNGSATISGGGGADLFVFSQSNGGGNDIIRDFNQASGDRILLSGYSTGAAALALSHAVVSGGGTTLTLEDNTRITITGVTNLSSNAFV
jgi:Ca2+-binding RTX toxin-like protein